MGSKEVCVCVWWVALRCRVGCLRTRAACMGHAAPRLKRSPRKVPHCPGMPRSGRRVSERRPAGAPVWQKERAT